ARNEPKPSDERLVVTAAEFLAERFDDVPSLWGKAFLVPGGSYLILAGDGGVGKTILLLNLFLLLAPGRRSFLRFELPGEPTPVLILEAEGSRKLFQERIRGIAEALGIDLPKLPVYFASQSAPLKIDDSLRRMIEQSKARAGLLDPIGRFHE